MIETGGEDRWRHLLASVGIASPVLTNLESLSKGLSKGPFVVLAEGTWVGLINQVVAECWLEELKEVSQCEEWKEGLVV